MTNDDDNDLDARIEELEAEERHVSNLRRHVHDRLAAFPNEGILEQERELSNRRHELHVEIDELRSERSRRREAAAARPDDVPSESEQGAS
jgi:hypothetical protein